MVAGTGGLSLHTTEDFELLEKAASTAPLPSPRQTTLGERKQTGEFGGSRGPNSVTCSLPSFSTVNPALRNWAGAAPLLPLAGCGQAEEKGAPGLGAVLGLTALGTPNQGRRLEEPGAAKLSHPRGCR